MTEDEMIGWHHRLNGREFDQTLGDSEGQGKPGMLQSMGLQRVRHNWVTEGQQSWGRCYAERFLYVALTEFYAGIQRG